MKRVLAAVLLLCVALALSACGEQPEEPGIYEPGTEVTLGSYEQDNDPDNGPEPIDWIVLECHGNQALLVSKYALETMPYYTASRTAVTWETSELRVWLNGSFWETAFTPEEQAMILTTQVKADSNKKYNVDGGADTEDRVFLLSYTELMQHTGDSTVMKSEASPYARARGAYIGSDTITVGGKVDMTCSWWLRTPGLSMDYVTYGHVDPPRESGMNASATDVCVRPVVWVEFPAE